MKKKAKKKKNKAKKNINVQNSIKNNLKENQLLKKLKLIIFYQKCTYNDRSNWFA